MEEIDQGLFVCCFPESWLLNIYHQPLSATSQVGLSQFLHHFKYYFSSMHKIGIIIHTPQNQFFLNENDECESALWITKQMDKYLHFLIPSHTCP